MVKKSILADTPKNLIKKYRRVLIKAGIPVEKMILFGSYAKGTAKPWSDIDVCVISSTFGKNPYNERVKLLNLTGSVEAMIEPHPFNPDDLTDPWNSLASEIRAYGKTIA